MHSTEFLDGVLIVTMAQNVPAPLAAMRMKQAGARVIKIEPPTGDPLLELSPAWHAEMHAGISIERLDLKADAGRERVRVLLSDADVFITSQRPSSLTSLGLDPQTLRARFPRLRMLRIVGSVREPERPGHDLTYQAQCGLLGDEMPRTLAADVMASERVFAGTLALLRQSLGSIVDVGVVESLDPLLAPLRHGLTVPRGPLGGGAPQYRVYTRSSIFRCVPIRRCAFSSVRRSSGRAGPASAICRSSPSRTGDDERATRGKAGRRWEARASEHT